MSEDPRSKTTEHEHLPPGAERFWGQVSETRAGRSHGGGAPEEESAAPEQEQAAGGNHACLEWCPICRSADLLRATTSPEAIGQVQAIQQEAVSVLKAFLAAYGERGPAPDRSADSAKSDDGSPGRSPGAGDTGGGRPVRDISID